MRVDLTSQSSKVAVLKVDLVVGDQVFTLKERYIVDSKDPVRTIVNKIKALYSIYSVVKQDIEREVSDDQVKKRLIDNLRIFFIDQIESSIHELLATVELEEPVKQTSRRREPPPQPPRVVKPSEQNEQPIEDQSSEASASQNQAAPPGNRSEVTGSITNLFGFELD